MGRTGRTRWWALVALMDVRILHDESPRFGTVKRFVVRVICASRSFCGPIRMHGPALRSGICIRTCMYLV